MTRITDKNETIFYCFFKRGHNAEALNVAKEMCGKLVTDPSSGRCIAVIRQPLMDF